VIVAASASVFGNIDAGHQRHIGEGVTYGVCNSAAATP